MRGLFLSVMNRVAKGSSEFWLDTGITRTARLRGRPVAAAQPRRMREHKPRTANTRQHASPHFAGRSKPVMTDELTSRTTNRRAGQEHMATPCREFVDRAQPGKKPFLFAPDTGPSNSVGPGTRKRGAALHRCPTAEPTRKSCAPPQNGETGLSSPYSFFQLCRASPGVEPRSRSVNRCQRRARQRVMCLHITRRPSRGAGLEP